MQILDLGGNELKNIDILSKVDFEELKTLNLKNNLISSLDALKNKFKKLEILFLSKNKISDIELLAKDNFKNLVTLYLDYNKVHNFKALENLKNLEELHLYGNYVYDDEITIIKLKKRIKKLYYTI